jgi:hypothetical protein
MIQIDYPGQDFRTRKQEESDFIFDELRKRWVKLTPEEWVRQNFLRYLIQVKNYPPSLIAIEKEIVLGELKKRFDILVYDQDHKPWMMIECKSMSVALSEDVLAQVLRYSISVPAQYLVITNGTYTTGWQKVERDLKLLSELPDWEKR